MTEEELWEEEHPSVKEGEICGATYTGGTGIEWICIRAPHNPGYVRKTGDRTHRRGSKVYGTGSIPGRGDFGIAPQADRHLFVNRYPYRPTAFDRLTAGLDQGDSGGHSKNDDGLVAQSDKGYCSDCPDHEACFTGYPCDIVKKVNKV